MASPDSLPEADPDAPDSTDPIEQRKRRFAILSRDDSLKGPAILLATGVLIQLGAACALGRASGIVDMLITVGVGSAAALPIDLIGQFIAASMLGTGFGGLRSAVSRLAAIIVFLQGLKWVVWLGFVSTDSVILLVGTGVLVGVIGFGLLMDVFDLSIFEAIVCLFMLACTEGGVDALLDWLDRSGVIHLTGNADAFTTLCLAFTLQLPL